MCGHQDDRLGHRKRSSGELVALSFSETSFFPYPFELLPGAPLEFVFFSVACPGVPLAMLRSACKSRARRARRGHTCLLPKSFRAHRHRSATDQGRAAATATCDLRSVRCRLIFFRYSAFRPGELEAGVGRGCGSHPRAHFARASARPSSLGSPRDVRHSAAPLRSPALCSQQMHSGCDTAGRSILYCAVLLLPYIVCQLICRILDGVLCGYFHI